jgi:NTP pyrophosphatase (non-canonical NTP hydrolase)
MRPISDGDTLNSYQRQAQTFSTKTVTHSYLLKGLVGEVGELFSLEAKAQRDGRKSDFDEKIKKELGDILWFVAMLAISYGYSLDTVAYANINKLTFRQAAGTIQGSGDDR